MKILHITIQENGGAGIACRRLHEELLNKGIDSGILVLRSNSHTNRIFTYCELRDSKSLTSILRNSIKILNKIFRIPLIFKPKGYENIDPIRNFNRVHNNRLVKTADIIHLHWVTNFIDYPSFLKKVDKPIVWSLHDMHPFSGGYHYECGLQLKYYNAFLRKNQSILTKSIRPNLIVNGISGWITKKAYASGIYSKNEMVSIPNGISGKHFFLENDPELLKGKFNIPKSNISILFISDSLLNKRKGVDLFINAMNQLKIDVNVILIGRKGKDIEKRLKKNVINLGPVKSEEILRQIYNAADITAIPSIEDNFPNACLESLFCGTPVIGFNSGGLTEMVEKNISGIICQEISVECFSKNLEIMAGNIDKFDKQRISREAQNKFDVGLMADRFISLYEKCLKILPE